MKELTEYLQILGLTSYEARVLIALTQYGSGTASDIHSLSGVPRSAVYGVITKLDEKGLIVVQNTKPMRYKSLPPGNMISVIKEGYEKAIAYSLEKLEEIYRAEELNAEEDVVWNINGVKNVYDKIMQMLESANEEIIFASSFPSLNKIPDTFPILHGVKGIVKEKLDRGVKVKLTGKIHGDIALIAKELQGAEVRVYESTNATPLKGGMLVIDDRELLVVTIMDDITPFNLSATWYNGKEHIRIFKHFIGAEWLASKPIDANGLFL